MTHTAVHSEFVSMGFNRKRRVSFPHDIYQVVVNGEEGEYAEYEVENEFKIQTLCILPPKPSARFPLTAALLCVVENRLHTMIIRRLNMRARRPRFPIPLPVILRRLCSLTNST